MYSFMHKCKSVRDLIITLYFSTVSECDVSSQTTLLDYLRVYLGLHGTKYMCREGGCGACIVSVNRPSARPYSVNSVCNLWSFLDHVSEADIRRCAEYSTTLINLCPMILGINIAASSGLSVY